MNSIDPHAPAAEAHQVGSNLFRAGHLSEAAEALARAARLAPGEPRYRISLAAALGRLGRHAQAVAELRAALIRGGGRLAELHNNLGASLEQLGRLEEAAAALANAVALRDDYLEARKNLARVLRRLGRPAAAAAACEAGLAHHAGDPDLLLELATVVGETGDAERAIAAARELVAAQPDSAAALSALLYTLHYCPEYDAERLHREHAAWGARFCEPGRGSIPPHLNDRDPERRIRVGYVSPDLREHTVTKFISAAIEHHDRERLEVTCYSDTDRPDHVTERIKRWAEHWHDTREMDPAALERLIRAHRIDILVDLRGHAAGNRLPLFARKPAPVQVNMVGYFNTTGLATMDYRLTDRHMDPPGGTEHLYTEGLIRIEPSCWCYAPEPHAPGVSDPPVLKNGYITFGSLNKVVKVSEPCARLWARVLEAVPGSRLLLSVAGDAAAAVRERLAGFGLSPDRLVLTDKTRTSQQYLERFNEIDLALDTRPFGGITTTCDGLWTGVPCVSLPGGTSVSRAGQSILHAANLPELAADVPDAFVRIACGLAGNVERLCLTRRGMRDRLRASPLMDHAGFARKLEAEYRRIWRAWCARR